MFACTQTRFAHPNFKPLWTVHVLVSPIHPWGFPRPPWTLSLRLFPGPVSTTTLRPTWDSDAAGSVPGCTMLADLKCPAKQIWLVGIVTQQWTILNITIFMGGNYRPQMVGLWHWVFGALCIMQLPCTQYLPAPNISSAAVRVSALQRFTPPTTKQRIPQGLFGSFHGSLGSIGSIGSIGYQAFCSKFNTIMFPYIG